MCFQDGGSGFSPKSRYKFPKIQTVPGHDPDLHARKIVNDAVLYTHTHTQTYTHTHTHTHTHTQGGKRKTRITTLTDTLSLNIIGLK